MNKVQAALERWYMYSVIYIFIFTGFLKVATLFHGFDSRPNAVFPILPESFFQLLAGVMEFGIALFLAVDKYGQRTKHILILAIGTLLSSYHLALIGKEHKCGCLGLYSGGRGWLPDGDTVSQLIVAYFILVSLVALLCRSRQKKNNLQHSC